MNTLKRITQDQLEVFEKIEANDGEITAELEAELMLTQENLARKSAGYIEYLNSLEGRNNLIKTEIARLQAMLKRNEQTKAFLQRNLQYAISLFGPIQTTYHRLSLRKSKQVIVQNVEAVPDRYKKIKQEIVIDKIALKEALEKGQIKATSDFYIQENQTLSIK